MNTRIKKELIAYLSGYVSENRLERFRKVMQERTGHIRLVLEDIYQAHNASAVLRSCDCFGVQHVYFIENRNSMKINDEVAMGSSGWLSIHKHVSGADNTRETLEGIRQKGYRIVAATPDAAATRLEDFDVKEKFALVFGTEAEGLSAEARSLADETLRITMYGFTESFNVSVSAALCLYELTGRIRNTVPVYRLLEEEQDDIYLQWLSNSIETGPSLIREFLNKKEI